MSTINQFALGLIRRQIAIYNENTSLTYDTTQPLSVLISCSIILFSDFLQKHNEEYLIKELFINDSKLEMLTIINKICGKNINTRVRECTKYLKDKKNILIKDNDVNLNKYISFFHDLRNEFAHIIEENQSKIYPRNGEEFKGIEILFEQKGKIEISKCDFINILNMLDKFLPKEFA